VTAIFILVRKNIPLETMYCFTQNVWRAAVKTGGALSFLAP